MWIVETQHDAEEEDDGEFNVRVHTHLDQWVFLDFKPHFHDQTCFFNLGLYMKKWEI